MSERPRYEWVSGPTLLARFERTEFHAGKGVLEPKGKKLRMLVGQIRDTHLDQLLNWAIRASDNQINARLSLHEFAEAWPKAKDWGSRIKRATSAIPKGWRAPSPGAEFVQGLMI